MIVTWNLERYNQCWLVTICNYSYERITVEPHSMRSRHRRKYITYITQWGKKKRKARNACLSPAPSFHTKRVICILLDNLSWLCLFHMHVFQPTLKMCCGCASKTGVKNDVKHQSTRTKWLTCHLTDSGLLLNLQSGLERNQPQPVDFFNLLLDPPSPISYARLDIVPEIWT